ncbi:MAG: MFS transporter, partial [Planctomycetota bacterium]
IVILAGMGMQTALFGPAKYGMIPELVPHARISMANGLLGMWTFFAIIAGTILGPLALESAPYAWVAPGLLVVMAVAGVACAYRIRPLPAAQHEGGLVDTVRFAWKAMRKDRALWLAAAGSAAFWGVSSLLGQNLVVYAKNVLELPDKWVSMPLGVYAVGIGIGSVLAGRISGDKIETGLIPLGAIGLAVLSLLTGMIAPGAWGLGLIMAALGVCSGFVLVPLDSLLQWRSPPERRGAVIALANTITFSGMLAGSWMGGVLAGDLGLSSTAIWTAAGVLTVFGTVWALWTLPVAFLRLLVFLYTHSLYRVTVRGSVHVPASGPALLTPNHVSYMDALFLIAALDRPVRFVVHEDQYNRPLFKPILKMAGAIPVASNAPPKVMLAALRKASEALDAGEIVCIFPEGQLTRIGAMLEWRRGFERIVKGRDVPIVPVHLDRVWGSIFSHAGGKLPREIPHKVTVSFGAPMPATTPLHRVRQSVVDLGSDAWELRRKDARTLHRRFLDSVRKGPWKPCVEDARSGPRTRLEAAAGAIGLARRLRVHWDNQTHVGILLPPSAASAILNVAAAFAGKIAVNLNWTAGRAGLASALRQGDIKTLVTSWDFLNKAKIELPPGVTPILLEDLKPSVGPISRFVAATAALIWPQRWVERYCGASKRPRIGDVATVIFSSGSTGEPKGVMLSHWNIGSNIEGLAQVTRVERHDRVLNVLPDFHAFGTLLTWFGLAQGVPQVRHPDPTDANAVGALVERHALTIAIATPTFLQLYMRRVRPEQFGSLRLMLTGAEKLRAKLADDFEERFGLRPLEGYGATECAPVIAVSFPSFRAAGFYQRGARKGSVGLPLPGITLRVVDPDTQEAVEPGEPGLLLVKGPNVMLGYLGRDPVEPGGWYETGDIATVDVDGFVTITDRLSRFSKIGGEMVPHGRVEEELENALDEGSERHFVVGGVPDEKKSERLTVLHTVDETRIPDLLIDLKERGLPNIYIPRLDHFIRVDELPVLGSGNVDLKQANQQTQHLATPS